MHFIWIKMRCDKFLNEIERETCKIMKIESEKRTHTTKKSTFSGTQIHLENCIVTIHTHKCQYKQQVFPSGSENTCACSIRCNTLPIHTYNNKILTVCMSSILVENVQRPKKKKTNKENVKYTWLLAWMKEKK